MLTNEQIEFLAREMGVEIKDVQEIFDTNQETVSSTLLKIICEEGEKSGCIVFGDTEDDDIIRDASPDYDDERLCMAEEIYCLLDD